MPALLVFVALGGLLAAYLALGGDVRDFLHIAPRFLAQGGSASPALRYDPSYHGYATDRKGYDGQFYYYIAVDPQHAPAYLDEPAYRFSRPLYPFLARALGFGQPAVIPWAMLGINWLAISGAVLALGDILRRRRFSPWFALIYALFPGVLAALHADVTEPLAYGLVALGLWLRERGGRRAWLWVGLALALATLTRETTAAFALALAIGDTIAGIQARRTETGGRNALAAVARPALWLAAVMAPYLAWKVGIGVWLGSSGVPSELVPAPLPFAGLAPLWPWPPFIWAAALFVGAPGVVALALAVWGLRRKLDAPEFWALALHVVFFCLLLRAGSWDLIAAFRLSIGSVLALVWALPLFSQLAGRGKSVRLSIAFTFTVWDSLGILALMTFFPSLARLLGS